MVVDIIILSNGKTAQLKQMTQSCIDSLCSSEPGVDFNVIVFDNENVAYNGARTVKYLEPFNYNQLMNKGVLLARSEYICLCNNDLVFQKDWCSNIIQAMEENILLSGSPLCPINNTGIYKPTSPIQYGYRLRHELNGWCIMVKREIFNIIGPLNEDFPFWFADNAYAEQLKKHGIKHALVSSSVVTHLGSKTLHTIDAKTQDALTKGWIKKWCAEFPENETSIYFKSHGY